jgi:hypothetical protein
MNALLHFIINNAIIHRLWDSVPGILGKSVFFKHKMVKEHGCSNFLLQNNSQMRSTGGFFSDVMLSYARVPGNPSYGI